MSRLGYFSAFFGGVSIASACWGFTFLWLFRIMNARHEENVNGIRVLQERSHERDRELAEFIAEFNPRGAATEHRIREWLEALEENRPNHGPISAAIKIMLEDEASKTLPAEPTGSSQTESRPEQTTPVAVEPNDA